MWEPQWRIPTFAMLGMVTTQRKPKRQNMNKNGSPFLTKSPKGIETPSILWSQLYIYIWKFPTKLQPPWLLAYKSLHSHPIVYIYTSLTLLI